MIINVKKKTKQKRRFKIMIPKSDNSEWIITTAKYYNVWCAYGNIYFCKTTIIIFKGEKLKSNYYDMSCKPHPSVGMTWTPRILCRFIIL